MNRRAFLASLSAVVSPAQQKVLLPTDVPDEYGFRIMWYAPRPPLDHATYRLEVGGLVEKPASFAVADLRKFPQLVQSSRLKCVQCWSSRADWGGFRFGELFEAVKPLKSAAAVRIDCGDKWYEHLSLDDALNNRVLLALDMEGQPLSDSHGAPLRVIDPRKYGYKSAKMITSITFVDKPGGSMACDLGPYYSESGEIQPGYDHPLDLGEGVRHKIRGGEIDY
jgi:DMSO/TMAO reductase YedYZ molybdopterin-dependent catalytic subunit